MAILFVYIIFNILSKVICTPNIYKGIFRGKERLPKGGVKSFFSV